MDISIKHCNAVERGLSSLSLEKLIDLIYMFVVTLDYLVKGSRNFYLFKHHDKICAVAHQP